jgi:hypothetical protein
MTIPHLPPKTLEEALVDLLESIALEETAIANLLNAETEKIKAINLEKENLQDVIKFQDNVHKLAKTLLKYQILLQFKLEIVENIIPRPLPPQKEDCVVVEKIFDQCFKEEVIVKRFTIPMENGQSCFGLDLNKVDRVDCSIVSCESNIVNISEPLPPPESPHRKVITIEQVAVLAISLIEKSSSSERILCSFSETITAYSNLALYVPPPGIYYGPEGGPYVHSKIVNSVCYCEYVLDPSGVPAGAVICTLKLCKIVAVTGLVNLLVPTSGYCQPRQCEAGPQKIEIECPPQNY